MEPCMISPKSNNFIWHVYSPYLAVLVVKRTLVSQRF
jgi:hypothetical protein